MRVDLRVVRGRDHGNTCDPHGQARTLDRATTLGRCVADRYSGHEGVRSSPVIRSSC